MFQLIITVIAIGLTAALVLVSINYLNPATKKGQDLAVSAAKDLSEISAVYSLSTATADGTSPAVTAAADGGFQENFLPYLKFTPKLLPGYSISYHKMASGTGTYSDLNFFCLSPGSTPASDITLNAINGLKAAFPTGQLVTTTSACTNPLAGATSSYSSLPNIVYFVRYIPRY